MLNDHSNPYIKSTTVLSDRGGGGGSQSRWAGIHRKRALSEMAAAVTHNSDSQLNRQLVEASD